MKVVIQGIGKKARVLLEVLIHIFLLEVVAGVVLLNLVVQTALLERVTRIDLLEEFILFDEGRRGGIEVEALVKVSGRGPGTLAQEVVLFREFWLVVKNTVQAEV